MMPRALGLSPLPPDTFDLFSSAPELLCLLLSRKPSQLPAIISFLEARSAVLLLSHEGSVDLLVVAISSE